MQRTCRIMIKINGMLILWHLGRMNINQANDGDFRGDSGNDFPARFNWMEFLGIFLIFRWIFNEMFWEFGISWKFFIKTFWEFGFGFLFCVNLEWISSRFLGNFSGLDSQSGLIFFFEVMLSMCVWITREGILSLIPWIP